MSDRKNIFYAGMQMVLACLCTLLNSLEYFAIALFIPYTPSSSDFLNNALLSTLALLRRLDWHLTLLLIVFLICLRCACNFANNFLQIHWSFRGETDYKIILLKDLLSKPFLYLEQQEPGALAKRLELDAKHLATIPVFINKYLISLPTITITSITLCIFVSWKIMVIALPFALSFFLLKSFISKRAHKKIGSLRYHEGLNTGLVVNLIFGLGVIKPFQLENYVLTRYKKTCRMLYDENLNTAKLGIFFLEFAELIKMCTVVSCAWFAFSVLTCTIQEILIIAAGFNKIYKPARGFAQNTTFINQAQNALAQYQKILTADKKTAISNAVILNTHLVLDGISFSYDNEWHVKPFSLSIAPGEKIAVVGKNGSGKSTILKVLAGIYPAIKGRIFLGGLEINDENRELLTTNITYTSQKPFIFSTSIRENIDPLNRLTLAEIMETAKHACADQFINDLPNGYETILHNDGASLSIGQRQKLHLARAFARKTPILILDESTSSLDRESENVILRNCFLAKEQTHIFVSHRTEILDFVTRVLYLYENGILQDGSPDQVTKFFLQAPLQIEKNLTV